ncbi:biosynthetic peptidoglycan transglycosylase [Sphingomonas sp. FW199]|uniref:biosynthetic peptidoglycan transglycosylase n=1 Tax=Sphingomonas sp. FW199 TaxID=3400217 RepID=UPI003CEE5611
MRPKRPTIRSSLLGIHRVILQIQHLASRVSNTVALSNLEMVVIALEDRRFFLHAGYDWRSICRELIKALMFRRFGGASTIDIQLFRTVSNRYERSTRRKIREAVGAFALQRKVSKIHILRVYLANAYFGTGLTGADSASLEIFQKFADELTIDEAAVIASMLVYPKPRLPSANWHAKISRRANYGGFLVRSSKERFYKINR